MKKLWQVLLLSLFVIILILIKVGSQNSQASNIISALNTTPSPTPSSSSFGGNGGSISTAPTPTPYVPPNPFSYTPLPTNTGGPENDISEVSFTESRNTAQIDDYITFNVTIQNVSSHDKVLNNLCFQSSDGNFGCVWNIHLAPGQTYSASNVGSWTSGGTKDIWVTWSQDPINSYQPLRSKTLMVNILG